MSQLKLFSAGSAVPEGFEYQPDIISPAGEEELLGRLRLRSERPSVSAGLEPSQLQQVLVTQHDACAGIGWHRDKAVFEWEHSIPEVDELRYSITFRNFRPAR